MTPITIKRRGKETRKQNTPKIHIGKWSVIETKNNEWPITIKSIEAMN